MPPLFFCQKQGEGERWKLTKRMILIGECLQNGKIMIRYDIGNDIRYDRRNIYEQLSIQSEDIREIRNFLKVKDKEKNEEVLKEVENFIKTEKMELKLTMDFKDLVKHNGKIFSANMLNRCAVQKEKISIFH